MRQPTTKKFDISYVRVCLQWQGKFGQCTAYGHKILHSQSLYCCYGNDKRLTQAIFVYFGYRHDRQGGRSRRLGFGAASRRGSRRPGAFHLDEELADPDADWESLAVSSLDLQGVANRAKHALICDSCPVVFSDLAYTQWIPRRSDSFIVIITSEWIMAHWCLMTVTWRHLTRQFRHLLSHNSNCISHEDSGTWCNWNWETSSAWIVVWDVSMLQSWDIIAL